MKKLKNLSITSTDLVDSGANPEAKIRLFKGFGKKEEKEMGAVGEKMDSGTGKEESKKELKMQPKKESKKSVGELSQEEKAVVESFYHLAEEYGFWEERDLVQVFSDIFEEKSKKIDTSGKSQKSEDVRELEEELALLKKSMKMREMEEVSGKYQVLGKDKDDLASMFYRMREVGEEFFSAYQEVLDEQMDLVEKSGLYSEIGKSGAGILGSPWEAAVSQVMKGSGMSRSEAVVRAYEENPELALEYEKGYEKSLEKGYGKR